MSSEENVLKVECLSHHIRQNLCHTRSPYRRGRRETAVKVFTISDESKYLLIQGVPDIKCYVKQELKKLCEKSGPLESIVLTDYPNCEEFTKTYLIKYKNFLNAIKAKKFLDDYNFLGSILHICYAPEFETIDETREKLDIRRRYVPKTSQKINNSEQTSHEMTPQEVESNDTNEEQISEDFRSNLKRKFDEMSDKSNKTEIGTNIETNVQKMTPKIKWRANT